MNIACFNDPIKELINKYQSGKLYTIYGNSATGRSTIATLAAIACAKINFKVIYIDTENKFSPERLKQLYFGDVNEILDNLFLFSPKSYLEQHEMILNVDKLAEKDTIKLIIIDSIGALYRNKLNENPKEINAMMTEQMVKLHRIARDKNKIVLLTNQVYSEMEGNKIRMVGGKLIEKLSHVIIELNNSNDNIYAKLIKYRMDDSDKKHYMLNKKIFFEIKENGLFSK
jgi:DNA repair protein RadB